MTDHSREEIEQVLRLADKATPGPWMWDADAVKGMERTRARVVATGRTITQGYYSDAQGNVDAAFIASAHTMASIIRQLVAENERITGLLNTPVNDDFESGVRLEMAHQREKWGADQAGKTPQDWFWLVGYLVGKALAAHVAGNTDKALHHCISSSAALGNWHAAIAGTHNRMRPGHGEEFAKAIDGPALPATTRGGS